MELKVVNGLLVPRSGRYVVKTDTFTGLRPFEVEHAVCYINPSLH